MAAFLDETFAALAVDGKAAHHYRFFEDPQDPGHWVLDHDGELVASSPQRGFVYSQLFWHANREAIRGCTDLLLLHSSCAADDDGRAVILPASMESGKTTTVAGLVRSGLRYVTDEATAIDPASGEIVPYPKPLSIDRGSWLVLWDLRPTGDPQLATFTKAQWQVAGDRIGHVSGRARPVLVVSPAYDATVTGVDVESMTQGETLVLLAQNAFNLRGHAVDGFRELEGVARSSPGYRMRIGDLDAAVDAIRRLLIEAPA